MHVRISNFTLGPGTRDIAEHLADEVGRLFQSSAGFHSASFFADWEAGDYGSYSVWKTRADADNAAAAVLPILRQRVGDLLKGSPTAKTFEIYVPKT